MLLNAYCYEELSLFAVTLLPNLRMAGLPDISHPQLILEMNVGIYGILSWNPGGGWVGSFMERSSIV